MSCGDAGPCVGDWASCSGYRTSYMHTVLGRFYLTACVRGVRRKRACNALTHLFVLLFRCFKLLSETVQGIERWLALGASSSCSHEVRRCQQKASSARASSLRATLCSLRATLTSTSALLPPRSERTSRCAPKTAPLSGGARLRLRYLASGPSSATDHSRQSTRKW